MIKFFFGVWECYVFLVLFGVCVIFYDFMVKILMIFLGGEFIDRIFIWIIWVI